MGKITDRKVVDELEAEGIIKRGTAVRMGLGGTKGRLVLTPKRLVFLKQLGIVSVFGQRVSVEIPISSISSVQRRGKKNDILELDHGAAKPSAFFLGPRDTSYEQWATAIRTAQASLSKP
jgi:hypothetical protein